MATAKETQLESRGSARAIASSKSPTRSKAATAVPPVSVTAAAAPGATARMGATSGFLSGTTASSTSALSSTSNTTASPSTATTTATTGAVQETVRAATASTGTPTSTPVASTSTAVVTSIAAAATKSPRRAPALDSLGPLRDADPARRIDMARKRLAQGQEFDGRELLVLAVETFACLVNRKIRIGHQRGGYVRWQCATTTGHQDEVAGGDSESRKRAAASISGRGACSFAISAVQFPSERWFIASSTVFHSCTQENNHRSKRTRLGLSEKSLHSLGVFDFRLAQGASGTLAHRHLDRELSRYGVFVSRDIVQAALNRHRAKPHTVHKCRVCGKTGHNARTCTGV